MTEFGESKAEQERELLLIVDDNPTNIEVLGTILKHEGYLLGVARNGLQALEMVDQSPPDLILLDIVMPEMDGYETCTRLKSAPETREIPVIFLTARTESEAVVRGFELGAVDYVTKPFNSAELLARVRTQLELRRAFEDLKRAHREMEEMQQQLLEAERLKILLETAGGAAHEINQPLQAITLQLEMMAMKMSKGDSTKRVIEEVLEQAERISSILRKMKDIQRYRSTPYVGDSRIIDFDAASQGNERE